MRATRFVLFLLAVSGLSLTLAFITPQTPDATDHWIMGLGAAIALVAAGTAVWLTENPLASVALLPLALASAIAGNYLPYLTGLWGLRVQDFASSGFPAGLAYLTLGTLALSLILGLLTEAAHFAVDTWLPKLTPHARGGRPDTDA
jgi:hypothetical protein